MIILKHDLSEIRGFELNVAGGLQDYSSESFYEEGIGQQ